MRKSDKNRPNREARRKTPPQRSVPLPEVGPLSSDGKLMSERGRKVIQQMLDNLRNSGKRPSLAKEQTVPFLMSSTGPVSSDGKPMDEADQRLLTQVLANLNNASRREREEEQKASKKAE